LWSSRALTYDVSKKHNFFMKTALIWIFNDFPAYEMVSSWNTHEKLVCSYCMENSKAFTLTNNSKNIFFSLSQAVLTNGSQIQKKHKRLFCWQSWNRCCTPTSFGWGIVWRDVIVWWHCVWVSIRQEKVSWFWFDPQLGKTKYFLRAFLLEYQSTSS
jgi:hypothetical protein